MTFYLVPHPICSARCRVRHLRAFPDSCSVHSERVTLPYRCSCGVRPAEWASRKSLATLLTYAWMYLSLRRAEVKTVAQFQVIREVAGITGWVSSEIDSPGRMAPPCFSDRV